MRRGAESKHNCPHVGVSHIYAFLLMVRLRPCTSALQIIHSSWRLIIYVWAFIALRAGNQIDVLLSGLHISAAAIA